MERLKDFGIWDLGLTDGKIEGWDDLRFLDLGLTDGKIEGFGIWD
jgi:hypothetical protein